MFQRLLQVWLVSLVALVSALPAHGQFTGFSASGSEIVEVLLSSDDGEVPFGRRWTIDGYASILAVEYQSPDRFFVVAAAPVSANHLLVFEAETGEVFLLDSFGVGSNIETALDGSGDLWLTIDGELYRYDPMVGSLIFQSNLATEPIRGLAWWQGQLFALTETLSGEAYSLVGLDPSSGSIVDSVELNGLPQSGIFYEVNSLDFDDEGGLWVGLTATSIADPPFIQGQAAYFADPQPGNEPLFHYFGIEGGWGFTPLAVTGRQAVVVVPNLSAPGLIGLAMLLATSALWALRRRGVV